MPKTHLSQITKHLVINIRQHHTTRTSLSSGQPYQTQPCTELKQLAASVHAALEDISRFPDEPIGQHEACFPLAATCACEVGMSCVCVFDACVLCFYVQMCVCVCVRVRTSTNKCAHELSQCYISMSMTSKLKMFVVIIITQVCQ